MTQKGAVNYLAETGMSKAVAVEQVKLVIGGYRGVDLHDSVFDILGKMVVYHWVEIDTVGTIIIQCVFEVEGMKFFAPGVEAPIPESAINKVICVAESPEDVA